MKPMIFTTAFLIAVSANGQQQNKTIQIGERFSVQLRTDTLISIAKPDTILPNLREQWRRNQIPQNGMPNAFTVKPPMPVYKGNNGQGFDIYESRIDGMPTLVPDSSFSSGMPNAFQRTDKKADSLRNTPLNPYLKKWKPYR